MALDQIIEIVDPNVPALEGVWPKRVVFTTFLVFCALFKARSSDRISSIPMCQLWKVYGKFERNFCDASGYILDEVNTGAPDPVPPMQLLDVFRRDIIRRKCASLHLFCFAPFPVVLEKGQYGVLGEADGERQAGLGGRGDIVGEARGVRATDGGIRGESESMHGRVVVSRYFVP